MQATSNEQRAQNKTQTNTRLDYGTHNNKCSGRLGHLAFSTPRVLLSPRGQGKSISAKNVLKMSLECLAIIGSKNDPLYLTATDDTSSKETSSVETEDAFGFLSETADGGKEAGKPSIRHEVCATIIKNQSKLTNCNLATLCQLFL